MKIDFNIEKKYLNKGYIGFEAEYLKKFNTELNFVKKEAAKK